MISLVIQEEYYGPEPMQRRNTRALAIADERDAAALRRAREFRPAPHAP